MHDMPWSTVWKVTRDGETLWRKRCNSIWRFEVPLTLALSSRWRDRTADVVESGDDWMLMRDAGETIDPGSPRWVEVVRLYAELQQGEAAHADEHLAIGTPDLRLAALPSRYADIVEHEPRMAGFEGRFAELCGELASHGFPETIQHDDLHQFNVRVDAGRIRIMDWGDSSVAHPFFSLVATLRHVDEAVCEPIVAAFAEVWDADRATVDLGLRVGRIAHALKGARQQRATAGFEDDDFPRVLALALAQTSE